MSQYVATSNGHRFIPGWNLLFPFSSEFIFILFLYLTVLKVEFTFKLLISAKGREKKIKISISLPTTTVNSNKTIAALWLAQKKGPGEALVDCNKKNTNKHHEPKGVIRTGKSHRFLHPSFKVSFPPPNQVTKIGSWHALTCTDATSPRHQKPSYSSSSSSHVPRHSLTSPSPRLAACAWYWPSSPRFTASGAGWCRKFR